MSNSSSICMGIEKGTYDYFVLALFYIREESSSTDVFLFHKDVIKWMIRIVQDDFKCF